MNLYVESTPDGIIISGDIYSILHNRRAYRFLKDTLSCSITDKSIDITNISDFNHCLDNIKYLANLCGSTVTFSHTTNSKIEKYFLEEEKFSEFSQKALSIRNNECDIEELSYFKDILLEKMKNRQLYDLQLLSAFHLAFSQNCCNFSVPGAGKTSVVYGAYAYLKNLDYNNKKHIDKLLIIGPLSSFAPWENEYEECFGRKIESKRLIGKMSLEEKKQYLFEKDTAELLLISYASVASIVDELKYYLDNNKVMVVLDEAHKIKNNNGGIIAKAVLSIAPECNARVVLTGTPAPNGYEDLYNLFKFIWPSKRIIKYQIGQLKDMSKNEDDYRVSTLINQVSPYFIRVKKSDLNIPNAINHPPIKVKMKSTQRKIYDFIEQNYIYDIADNQSKLFKATLIRARIIRLMQAATNPSLLKQPLTDFAEIEGIDLSNISDDSSIINAVLNCVDNEIPAKFEKLYELVQEILSRKEKVVIWACYIRTIEFLSTYLKTKNVENEILYGKTPLATDEMTKDSEDYEFTREAIITKFNNKDSGLNVIIANPFAVAESISLHKSCHSAIYLERSFNAAHFIQSKDRIHRYGLSPETETHYYYIVSEDSIDETINDRLEIKERRLLDIMEKMPIPLFDNTLSNYGRDDIKAVLNDYARRIKTK